MKTYQTLSFVALCALSAGLSVNATAQTSQLSDPSSYQSGHQSGHLRLIKTVDKAQVSPGELLTYTTMFTNVGSEPLSSIVIHDDVPEHTEYVRAECMPNLPQSLGNCTVVAPNGMAAGSTVRWRFANDLQPGVAAQVTLVVRVKSPTH